jgi:hypothetical protein
LTISVFQIIKIPNQFIKNSYNISTITKIIRLSAIKYKIDKVRQERSICLILTCIFSPCLVNQSEKALFSSVLKEIFGFETSNFIEEILSSLLKDQMNEDGLIINTKQVQKMIDLYTGLRVNHCVILSGSPLDGKSTLWKTIARAMNNSQFNEKSVRFFRSFFEEEFSIILN